MKIRSLLLLTIAALVLTAGSAPASAAICGSATSTTLFAGQTIDSGTVTTSNDGANLYVNYSTVSPWVITQTHLAVAGTLAGIPQTKGGNPIPGHFAYSTSFNPGVSIFTYTIPLSSLPTGELFIAAHAIVQEPGNTQTGWAFGQPFAGANWATYVTYTIQDCGGPVE